MTLPPFLTRPDPDGLSAIERAALKPLRERFTVLSQTDAWWFGVEQQRGPDRIVVPLTLARLDRFCREVEAGVRHRGWSISPEGVA